MSKASDQGAVAQLMKDLEISATTAEFIRKSKTIPDDSKVFPSDTPIADLINIKKNSFMMEAEDAYISVYVELGIRDHVTTATVVYV